MHFPLIFKLKLDFPLISGLPIFSKDFSISADCNTTFDCQFFI